MNWVKLYYSPRHSGFSLKLGRKGSRSARVTGPTRAVCAASLVYFSWSFEDDEDNGEEINQGSFFCWWHRTAEASRTAQRGRSGGLTSMQKQTLVKLNVLKAGGCC